MKTIILAESRNDFLTDISTSMLLEAYPFQLIQASSLQEACSQAAKNPSAVLVISEAALEGADISDIPANAYGYATTPYGNETLQSFGIASIGLCRTSGALLDALSDEPIKTLQKSIQAEAKPQNASKKEPSSPKPKKHEDAPKMPQQNGTPAQNTTPSVSEPVNEPQPNMQANTPAGQVPFTPEMMMQMMQMLQQMQGGQPAAVPASPPPATVIAEPTPPLEEPAPAVLNPLDPAAKEETELEDAENEEIAESVETSETISDTETVGSAMRSRKREREQKEIDADIEEDILAKSLAQRRKTVVASVYAAKGGVGKTSISTELAVCLALTSNGRRRFRVCILDYNIDFGDVATTLELNESGPNMSYWAAEIREMIERGQSPDDIQFTKQQMEERYLQCMDKTGLFALCAPITHEDSMLIKPIELEVMLRNIVANGEFDYVICDTGNNTRDSSIIAIDHSDFIFLVATQDITTANCNASVLRTLEDSGFDVDKVRLIINNIMSSRETGISVQEVEETFPYQCICRIKRTPDIIRANNLSQPLVYKPNHEYTKQIQRLVRFITAGEIQEEAPKRGWARWFGR